MEQALSSELSALSPSPTPSSTRDPTPEPCEQSTSADPSEQSHPATLNYIPILNNDSSLPLLPQKRRRVMPEQEKLAEVIALLRILGWTTEKFLHALERHRHTKQFSKQYSGLKRFAYSQKVETRLSMSEWKEWFLRDGIKQLGRAARQELNALQATPCFGTFDIGADAMSISHISDTANVLDEKAPFLVQILKEIPRESRAEGNSTAGATDARHITITAILGNIFHRTRFSAFQTSMGLYFYSSGLRRRALGVTAKLGLTRGPDTVAKVYNTVSLQAEQEVRRMGQNLNAVITYDNFDYVVGVRGERIGDHREQRSITTALITAGRNIPGTGLLQSMWNPLKPLTQEVFWRRAQRDDQYEEVYLPRPESSCR